MTLDRINIPIELFSLPLKGKYEMVIIALAYSFGDKGLRISNGKLAKVLHTSSRTIERVIAKLRKNGFLIDAGNRENGRCLKISTDIKSGVYTDIKPVSTTDVKGGNYRRDVAKHRHDVGHKLIKLSNKEKPVCDDNIPSENKTGQKISPGAFSEYWHSYENLPKIHTFTDQRKRALATRSKELAFADNWRLIIEKLSRSPFYTGQTERKWRADVDWILKNDTNYVRILELVEPDFSTREVSEAEAEQFMQEVERDN